MPCAGEGGPVVLPSDQRRPPGTCEGAGGRGGGEGVQT